MSRKTTLTIQGRGGTDFPTVEDFTDQLRDHIELLKNVEQAITDGTNAIVWRIVKAETNSPIRIETEAFPREFAVYIDDRAEVVVRHTALGLQTLLQRNERPRYFTDAALRVVERLFERVTNGLDNTVIEYGPGLPRLDLTPQIARTAIGYTRKVLRPEQQPYQEIGLIEGYAKSIDRDGYGRRLLWVHHRLTGETIKCIITGKALEELEKHQIGDVWRGRRVQVHGQLHFRDRGRLSYVDGFTVLFLRSRGELPDLNDIQDADFTGGQRSEAYLERLRDGKPS